MKHYEVGKLDESKYEILKWEQPIGGSRPRLLLEHKENHQRYILKTYINIMTRKKQKTDRYAWLEVTNFYAGWT